MANVGCNCGPYDCHCAVARSVVVPASRCFACEALTHGLCAIHGGVATTLPAEQAVPVAAELAALREVAGAVRMWLDGAGLSDALASTLRKLDEVTGPTPPTRLVLLERVAEAAQTLADEQPGDGAVTIGRAEWDRLNAALAALDKEEVHHG